MIAKPSMPLTQAMVASGTLMVSGAGEVAIWALAPRNLELFVPRAEVKVNNYDFSVSK